MIWTSLLGEVARLYHLLLSEWNTLGDLQIVRREFGFELVQARVARWHNLRPIREFLEISPPKKYTVKRSANGIETALEIICTRGKGGSTTVYNAVSQVQRQCLWPQSDRDKFHRLLPSNMRKR